MNVLFVANDTTVFNSQSPARVRARAYAKEIGALHIMSSAPQGASHEVDGSLTLHPLLGPRLFTLVVGYFVARSIIHRHGITVVSAQDPFENGCIAWCATLGTAAKLHLQIHTDFLSPWFTRAKGFRAPKVHVHFINRIRQTLASFTLTRAQGIRAVSHRIRDAVIRAYHIAPERISVIPIAIERSIHTSATLPPHEFTFSLITVGRLECEKRIEDILFALARIAQRYVSVGLFVVGEGSEKKHLMRLTKRLGLQKRVLFLGERSDAQGLMLRAHAYIQASAYEGYGRTLIEAALAKLPIITTDVGIVGEVFKGYEDVLSTPVADPVQLAVHITRLVEDHQARLLLVIHAERKAMEHLTTLKDQPQKIAADLARI